MKKNFIIFIITTLLVTGTTYYIYTSQTNKDFFTVMRSIPQGDLIDDQRTPEEACSEYLTDLQKTDYPNYFCSLSSSERIDNDEDYAKCPDGASIA